jgi:glycosidase
MFPSQVASFNAEHLLGTNATTAQSNFNTDHPLYKTIAELARIRRDNPALRRGVQIVRNDAPKPGLFAVSRLDPKTGAETVIAFNTSTKPISVQVEIDPNTRHFAALHGRCDAAPTVPGSYHVQLDGLDYVICEAGAAH